MKILRIMPIIGIIFIVCSCSSNSIKYSDFYVLTKETTINEFNEGYGKNIEETYSLEINGKKYEAFFTTMTTFKYLVQHGSSFDKTSYTTTHYFKDDFIFVFHNDKYLYSGFIYEFILHDNQELVKIGNELKRHIKTEFK